MNNLYYQFYVDKCITFNRRFVTSSPVEVFTDAANWPICWLLLIRSDVFQLLCRVYHMFDVLAQHLLITAVRFESSNRVLSLYPPVNSS